MDEIKNLIDNKIVIILWSNKIGVLYKKNRINKFQQYWLIISPNTNKKCLY